MFVRWQTRAFTHWSNKGRVSYNAVLCESFRDADGKPKQKHIANLGGITSDALQSAEGRAHFWKVAEEALRAVKLSRENRERIYASLAKRVGNRPTTKQVAAEKKRTDRALAALVGE